MKCTFDVKGRTFKSTKVGYGCYEKRQIGTELCQSSVNVVRVKSEGQPAPVGSKTLELDLQPKTFSTGKTGWFFSGKVQVDGQPYQVIANIVKLS